MYALLKRYSVSNGVSTSLLMPIKDNNLQLNASAYEWLQILLWKMQAVFKGLIGIEDKETQEKIWEKQGIPDIIYELMSCRAISKGKGRNELPLPISILFKAFCHVEQVKFIRKLSLCNTKNVDNIIRDWCYWKRSMFKTFHGINHQINIWPVIGYTPKCWEDISSAQYCPSKLSVYLNTISEAEFKYKPYRTLEEASKDESIVEHDRELAVFGWVRHEMKPHVPNAIHSLKDPCSVIIQFYPGHGVYDRIIDLISDKFVSMDHFDDSVKVCRLFMQRFDNENVDFYKVFGAKLINQIQYLSKYQHNFSVALRNSSRNLQIVNEMIFQNHDKHQLEFQQRALQLFVQIVSNKYNHDYEEMIFDIENGYESLDYELKSDVAIIYKLFRMVDDEEAKQINDAFKRHAPFKNVVC